jgi:hypothetical protein
MTLFASVSCDPKRGFVSDSGTEYDARSTSAKLLYNCNYTLGKD